MDGRGGSAEIRSIATPPWILKTKKKHKIGRGGGGGLSKERANIDNAQQESSSALHGQTCTHIHTHTLTHTYTHAGLKLELGYTHLGHGTNQ